MDPSNISPLVMHAGQILWDDGSTLCELWAGMNPPKAENGGGDSGTISGRHSVSHADPWSGSTPHDTMLMASSHARAFSTHPPMAPVASGR